MSNHDDLALAAEFPPATREQWRKLVEDLLKGAPFETRLVAKTYDALGIEPLYGRRVTAQPIASRAPAAPLSSPAPSALTATVCLRPSRQSRARSTAFISTPASRSILTPVHKRKT